MMRVVCWFGSNCHTRTRTHTLARARARTEREQAVGTHPAFSAIHDLVCFKFCVAQLVNNKEASFYILPC